MMTENKATQTKRQFRPMSDLKSLERIVGTWVVSGSIKKTHTFK